MLTTVELEELAQCIESDIGIGNAYACDEDGWTLMHSAAYYGNTKLLEHLLRQDPCPNLEITIPGTHMTPLLLAATTGHYDAFALLLEYGANINATDHMNRTALHLTQSGKIAELLLQRGINCHIEDKSLVTHRGETALETAMREGKLAVQSAILKFTQS